MNLASRPWPKFVVLISLIAVRTRSKNSSLLANVAPIPSGINTKSRAPFPSIYWQLEGVGVGVRVGVIVGVRVGVGVGVMVGVRVGEGVGDAVGSGVLVGVGVNTGGVAVSVGVSVGTGICGVVGVGKWVGVGVVAGRLVGIEMGVFLGNNVGV